MRKGSVAMVLAGLTVASIAFGPTPASGQVGCPTRHLFVHATGGNPAISWGQATTNMIRDIAPDPGCIESNRHSMAHIRDFLDPNAGIAEVGWWRGVTDAEHTFLFYAVRPPGGAQVATYFHRDDLVNVWHRFRTQVVDFTNRWRFFYDNNLDGSSYTELSPAIGVDAGFPNGYPMGETARVGAVSAYDHHVNLWRRNNVGAWGKWGGQALEVATEDIVGYHWHRNSNIDYEVHVPEAQHAN